MMARALVLFLVFFASGVFFACSDDNDSANFPFERTVLDVSVAKRCADGSFTPGNSCYLLLWRHPIERNNLESYYVWLDTLIVKDSVQNISQSQLGGGVAVAYSGKGDGDSLDLTNLVKDYSERDSLHVAIWAKYKGGDQGAVQHLYIYFGDDVSPSIVQFSDSAAAGTIWLNWMRPTDQRDFYFPEVLNGAIAGYNVLIQSAEEEDIRNARVGIALSGSVISNSQWKRFYRFKKEGRGVALEATASSNSRILRFAIIDGLGFNSENVNSNSWTLEISGLKPKHSYSVSIVAFDSAGNPSSAESGGRVIATTDTIAPLIANRFWLYPDSGDGLPRLDSNRLILFWPKSVDPLAKPTQIELDSTLRIPANCYLNACYQDVKNYIIEQRNGKNWENIPRIAAIGEDYYSQKYEVANDTNGGGKIMAASENGNFVSDTLRWIFPKDTLILRIRAVDFSGHYSPAWIDTIVVSGGKNWENKCPPGFAPVKKDSSYFCIEKLEHADETDKTKFAKAVLYSDAVEICEKMSVKGGFENYSTGLCTEDEWNAACTSEKSNYGVIEERGFLPSEFLFRYCNAGTGDSLSAYSMEKRNKICASSDGVRDLPGALQEWVIGKDTSGTVPILKGTSYVIFEGASRTELAQCRVKANPTRIRPRYTTDSVYLYKNGSRLDTLLARDSLRTLYSILPPSSFTDTILVYNLYSLSGGELLGEDYIDNAEYNRRRKDEWLPHLWEGLNYEPKEKKSVLILGTEKINAAAFFVENSVGFRCCARIN